jgi:hypothetical protein
MQKRLQTLTEIVPNLSRVAVLRTVGDAHVAVAMAALTQAAPDLSVKLLTFEIRSADDLEQAFAAMMNIGPQALIVIGTAGTNAAGARIAELALAHHLPACYPFRDTVAAGGLVSFSPHFDAIARRGADYVSKIVKGAKPSELPVEQLRDTRFTSILRPRRRSRSKCRRQCSPAPTRLSSRSASIHVSAAQAHGRNWHSFSVEGEAAMRQLSGAYRPCQFRMTACV